MGFDSTYEGLKLDRLGTDVSELRVSTVPMRA